MEIVQHIQWGLYRTYLRLGSHLHWRHWRGHGIHSPFVYGLVRGVFMKNHLSGKSISLYTELRANRVPEKQAVLLQNLFRYGNYQTYSLVGIANLNPMPNYEAGSDEQQGPGPPRSRTPLPTKRPDVGRKSAPYVASGTDKALCTRDGNPDISNEKGRNLCILLPGAGNRTLTDRARVQSDNGGCLVVLVPHRNRKTWQAARAIPGVYPCVSIDRRGIRFYFFDRALHPQHFSM